MPALEVARHVRVAGLTLHVVTAVHLLAMKLESFHGRGNDDVMSSHDLEDPFTVIDGRAEIVDELRGAASDVRTYVASETRALLERRDFLDALPGFLLPDATSQARVSIIRDRLGAIGSL